MDDEEGYRKKRVAEWRMRQKARIYTAKRRSVNKVTWDGGNKQRPKGASEQMKSGDRRAKMQGRKQARAWVDA